MATKRRLSAGLAAVLAAAVILIAGPARAEDPVYEFGVLPQVATAQAGRDVGAVPRQAERGVRREAQVRHRARASATSARGRRRRSYAFYYHNTLAYVQQDDRYVAFAREVGAKTKGVLVVAEGQQALEALRPQGRAPSRSRAPARSAPPCSPSSRSSRRAGSISRRTSRSSSPARTRPASRPSSRARRTPSGGLTRTFELLPDADRARLRIFYTTKEYSPLPFAARKDVPADVVAKVQKALVAVLEGLRRTPPSSRRST